MVPLENGWRRASSTNPATWRTYEAALKAFETGRYAGVGRVISKDGGLVGIDLDHVRNPHTGQIDNWAWEILESLDSYAEVSPSGKGVKIWVRAELERSHKKPGLEIYRGGRYFTVTGQILSRYSGRVEERTLELRELVLTHFPRPRFTSKEHRKPYDGPSIELVEFLEAAGIEFREIADGSSRTFAVVCPWWLEHSDEDTSGTRVGQYANGALWFRCEHAHCAHRRWGDFPTEDYCKDETPRLPRSDRGGDRPWLTSRTSV